MNSRFLVLISLFSTPVWAQDWSLKPVSALQKLTATAPGDLRPFTATPVQIEAARGEFESFQFVVSAGKTPIEKLEIRANGLATPGVEFIATANFQFFRENFVEVKKPSGNRDLRRQFWPDALIPLVNASQKIEAGKSAVFWATLHIPEKTAPGDYFGELDIVANGEPRRLALSLHVNDIVVPKPTFRATVAVYYESLRDWYRKDGKVFSDEEWEIQKRRFYEFLLDYRVNAYDLPVAWDSPAAEKYLLDERVTAVRVPPLDSPEFALALEKLKATKTLSKAFYYRIDEPEASRNAEIKAATETLRPIGIKHLVTTTPNEDLKNDVDIWCPNTGDFFGIGHLGLQTLQKEREKGRETWVYTMVEPKYPYSTWLLDDSAPAIRDYTRLWRKIGATGFVYSMAHGWGPKPFENLESFAETNGDGTLLYPGESIGAAGPLPSIRLMLLRDALEDFELERTHRGAFYSPFAQRAAWFGNLTRWIPFGSGLFTEPKLFRSAPIEKRIPAIGNALLTSQRESDAPLPISRVGWKREAQTVIVTFFADQPQEKDYVAVELAPLDASEKWRFVATFAGKTVVERRTRSGTENIALPAFRAQISRENDAVRVQMTIPLAQLDFAKSGVRFDAFRRTTVAATGTRFSQRVEENGGDPFAFPILSERPAR